MFFLSKVKNETIQSGALNDFLMVFNRAYTVKPNDKVQWWDPKVFSNI